jgi:hypothetical protein
MDEVKHFQVVEFEWREAYDREWGLALVTSVDQGDGYVWITQIDKDEEGYYLAPRSEYRHKSRMLETNKIISDISVKLNEK